ncbi:MAG TPA: DUF599 family protein [Azospirillaceae bacterium]|nr:DUF599 family protein [Azospirillaceae bacterium]
MPPDLTTIDTVAFVWFVTVWIGYTVVQDHLLKDRFGVNQNLIAVREHWMRRFLERDTRIMDAALFGHTMHSVTFFASTTMLVVAGLVGLFGAMDKAHAVASELFFTVKTSRAMFELKLLVLLGVFVWAFFKFTWAIRQYNYCCALIGAAPAPPVASDQARPLAVNLAAAITLAVASFNEGLRGYYFALAALTWFIQPWLFMTMTGLVILVLLRRQVWSSTFRVIHAQAQLLDSVEPDGH